MKLILSILFAALLLSEGIGQTITLGSGTNINGVTTNCPVNINNRRAVAQMVYARAELNAAGISGASTINRIGFFLSNPPIYELPNYTIQMKHTTATDAGGNLNGGYTTIVNSFNYAPGYGWEMIDLDNPFNWNGTNNVVVRICFSQVSPNRDPSGQVRVYNSTNGYKYRRDDNTGSACGLTPNIRLNTKPQIRFVFDTKTVWIGTVGTDPTNALNWSAGVPDETIDAEIPIGALTVPLWNSIIQCKNLLNDGTLTLGPTGEIVILESFTNNGTFNDLGGVVRTTGIEACSILPNVPTLIENLIGASSGGTNVTGDTLFIGTSLAINRGDFNTGNKLVMKSDATRTGAIREIRTTCTFTVNMTDVWGDGWNGGFLTVYEDGVAIETISAEGSASSETFKIEEDISYSLEYTSGIFENENAYTLLDDGGTPIFNDGPTPSTGVVFISTAAGCSFAPTIIGDVTMERHIDAGETYWRYFSSAVQGATIGQYNDDFVTSGYPGSAFPDFRDVSDNLWPSIYRYDETTAPGLGYIPASSTAEVIAVGAGLQVWCGDTITGTLPFNVDLTGAANQGNIPLPVSFTSTGTPAEDGYCLVGNPYPSAIDWDSPNWIRSSNISSAVYIQDPDTRLYASYSSGASTNGGSRFIASQQSFWVQAISAAPLPTLIAREKVKVNNDPGFFRAESNYSSGMKISLIGNALQDECVLRHIDESSEEFDIKFDAKEYFGGWGSHPQISLVNYEGKDFSIQSFNKGNREWSIPLRVIVFESGAYTLNFLNASELGVPCLKLEDRYTGEIRDISENTALEVVLSDTTYAPRFILHLGKNVEHSVTIPTCHKGSDGQISLDLELDEIVSYTLIKEGEANMFSSIANPIVVKDLSSGIYSIEVPGYGGVCEIDNYKFVILEPKEIAIKAEIMDDFENENGSILLDVSGGKAPYTYAWTTGENTEYIENLSQGLYTAEVIDANACKKEVEFGVQNTAGLNDMSLMQNIYFDQEEQAIKFTGKYSAEDILILSDVSGKRLGVFQLGDLNSNNIFLGPLNLSKGTYIISNQNSGRIFKFMNP